MLPKRRIAIDEVDALQLDLEPPSTTVSVCVAQAA